MTTRQEKQFGFFQETDGVATGRLPPWNPLPANVSTIDCSSDHSPSLAPVVDEHGFVDEHGDEPPVHAPVATLEIVQHGFQSRIALMTPADSPIRVNGMRPGLVTILNVKDQLQLTTGHVWHLSVLHQPDVSAATEDEIGTECLLCRTPIAEGQTVYRCTNCGAALHCGGPDRPAGDRLECAVASGDCPRCRRRLVREERFEYVPVV